MTQTEPTYGGVVGRTVAESTPWWPEPGATPSGAPNVVFMVFDDVGFSDFGCYGSEIETPNIDRLAAGGLRYTNFHTTALCSPTRAALLTGRNHHSAGMGGLASWDMGYPGQRGRVARSAGTIAEMLREQGYNTFATGKWHLTPMAETSAAGPYEQWPTQRGFDRFYGFLEGETSQWHPELVEDNHHIEPPDRPGYHLTEDIVDRSIQFIRGQQSMAPEKPFFLYLCFGACHAPHHVPREYIDKYVPVFEKGWDRTREDRLARQKELGVVPPETELPPRNEHVRAWGDLSDDERRLYVRYQAAYAGMMNHTDEHIGRFLGFLEEIGQFENTLIVLLSDNGASQEGSPFGTMNALRYFNRVRDTLDVNLPFIDEIGEAQHNNNYPIGWAMAGNTPLKRYKQNTHGGGVRDPLILHWPAGIGERGGIRRQFHHVCDVTPTVLDILGVEPPATLNGVAQQPIEGVSMRSSFDAPDAPTVKETQYFEMLGHRGIWHQGWKAVTWHRPGTSFDDDAWELYHLDDDVNECRDLAGEHPEKLRELIGRWWEEAERYQVLPLNDAQNRWAIRNPHSLAARRHWVFLPGIGRVPHDAAPDIKNRSYTITAEVEIPEGGAEGAIIAQGDSCGGYALYIKDGHLVHDYNFVGRHHVVTSDIPVPAGPVRLRFAMTKTGDFQGKGTLYIDDTPAGEIEIPATYRAQTSFIGLEVGRAPAPAVGDFDAPFPFTGTIDRVVIELADDQQRDPAAELAAAVGTQ
ncbi:MAG: sulfatase-like hydrolase/transferase [Dehalococcoidia bacterium]